VVIRKQPTTNSDKVSFLEKGDEITAIDVFTEQGIEWVKLAKGACALRNMQKEVPLDLAEDGFVATALAPYGTQLRKQSAT
ncbi:unnamed protein product, partial [Symbiodinium pilosum]